MAGRVVAEGGIDGRPATGGVNGRPASAAHLADILTAIGAGEMLPHYQPMVSLSTGRIAGVEALARWARSGAQLLPPDQFVPHLEHARRASDLSSWMLERVCADLAEWQGRHELPDDFVVAVNVSGSELGDSRLIRLVGEAAQLARVLPASVCLEITETAPLSSLEVAARVVGELADLGVRVALDDYGVGHLGPEALDHLPVHLLKIPRMAMLSAVDSHASLAALRGLIAGAQARGLQVVAEGLESDAQVDFARRLGCDIGQGFGLARPGPASVVLPTWLRPTES
jgi:EAL domain-containing protein (putative c-di-GMP-specific phosphodiesterase class I)